MDCFNKRFGLTALATVFLVAGCASNQTMVKEIKPVAEKIVSDREIFAMLDVTPEGRYYFRDFTFSGTHNFISLNTLQHYIRTESVKCGDAIDSEAQKAVADPECKQDKLAMFRVRDSTNNSISFDEELFEKALAEALVAQPREQLIAEFNNIYQLVPKFRADKKAEYDKRWNDLNTKLQEALVVNDNSQLYDGKPNAYIFERNPIEEHFWIKFKWQSASDFRVKLQEEVSNHYANSRLTLRCDRLDSFHHTISGCDQKWGMTDKLEVKPVVYEIDTVRNYGYAPTFNASDVHVSAVTDRHGVMSLTNLTDYYVTIDSLSLYVGDEIKNLSNLNLSLPPRSISKDLKLSKYSIFSRKSFNNIRKADLVKSINIGMAIKYKVADINVEKTLFKTGDTRYKDMPGWVI
ncbi:hypothetical protein [Rheinheimera maricola]|uniref:Lipoprotein n=1 Tax=Rheinheimera maricola TaxID=2793282 RepID=A0ABS7X9V9_9GAMM|nr:hypothetical protein [Rheinheimera maricola]MBZ9612338.1 hypothetical protein [Rheinheimera maricola]